MGDYDYDEPYDTVTFLVFACVAAVSFWLQAIITEERFVPALNFVSKQIGMSDDVAGATIMAAGASSPELMAALLSIFVTHSEIGMGTILGSEIFNQLVMSAGAILSARDNHLQLDPVVVMREITFYTISLMLLVISLSDRHPVYGDDIDHIYITFADGAILVGCYCVYVVICANFDTILGTLKVDTDAEGMNSSYECAYNAFGVQENVGKQKHVMSKTHAIPFVRSLVREPSSNFESSKNQKEQVLSTAESVVTELYSKSGSGSFGGGIQCKANCEGGTRLFLLDKILPDMGTINGINDIEINEENNSMSCYLWQQSSFYDKARMDINAWHLRWFTITCNQITSVSVRDGNEGKRFTYPSFDKFQVDEAHLLLKIMTVDSEKEYIFLAPSEKILSAVVRNFDNILQQPSVANSNEHSYEENPEEYESLIATPENCSIASKILHFILFPLKALIHCAIPDVRHGGDAYLSVKAIISIVLSIFFLILSSYAMVTSLESIAHELDIPEEIVGATISAAGTSLPNLIASQVAARQGLGNMAISNVFGSNTFNILIGLGLPWLIYTSTKGGLYNEMREEDITETLVVMVGTLLVFFVILIRNNFNLYKGHAYLFLGMYALFVIASITQCYV